MGGPDRFGSRSSGRGGRAGSTGASCLQALGEAPRQEDSGGGAGLTVRSAEPRSALPQLAGWVTRRLCGPVAFSPARVNLAGSNLINQSHFLLRVILPGVPLPQSSSSQSPVQFSCPYFVTVFPADLYPWGIRPLKI